MNVKVICDERTKEDKFLGVNARAGWNERPFYLLNKVLQSQRFQLNYLTLDGLALEPIDGGGTILHLDQTIHPKETTDCIDNYISRGIKILNGKVTDISKRHIDDLFTSIGGTKLRVQREDSYDGLVIVKSNYNAGDVMGREYSVLKRDNIDDVLWENHDVVIQRFVSSTNRVDILKRMDRYVMFMGEIVYCSFFSENDIIKRDTSIWQYYRDIRELRKDFEENKQVCLNERGAYYKELSPLEHSNKERMVEFCRFLNLDFGSIDTITDSEGNFYVLDVNKTPWERGIPEYFLNTFRSKLIKLSKEKK